MRGTLETSGQQREGTEHPHLILGLLQHLERSREASPCCGHVVAMGDCLGTSALPLSPWKRPLSPDPLGDMAEHPPSISSPLTFFPPRAKYKGHVGTFCPHPLDATSPASPAERSMDTGQCLPWGVGGDAPTQLLTLGFRPGNAQFPATDEFSGDPNN